MAHGDRGECLNSLLIAQITLDDIRSINASRKGKARLDAPLTDEEQAFILLEEESAAISQSLQLALSLQRAIDGDLDEIDRLSIVEAGAVDDHRYAEALSHGRSLPEKSDAQRALEDPVLYSRTPSEIGTQRDKEDEKRTESRPVILTDVSLSSTASGSRPFRVDCVICGENVRSSTTFLAPCGDSYCLGCLRGLVEACIGDESLFPLRCCSQSLPVPDVLPLLSVNLRMQFNNKAREFGTLATYRVYCANPTCSHFLGSSETATKTRTNIMHCPKCPTSTCTLCKQPSHPNKGCSENTALIALKALAAEQHWQTCPQCKAIIELKHGCFHMTCNCRMQFCYLCAAPWKNCQCPQWEEARLLDTAALRVEREVGLAARVAEPAVFERRVQERARQLRYNHDCYPHRWRHHQGGGTCEECGHFLPLFLKGCRDCHIMVCVRCMRNRL